MPHTCLHYDLTFIQSFRTRKGANVIVFECDYCGKQVTEVDHTAARTNRRFLVFSN